MHGNRIVAGLNLHRSGRDGRRCNSGGVVRKRCCAEILNPPMRTPNAEALPYLQRIFEQIGWLKLPPVQKKRATRHPQPLRQGWSLTDRI